MKMMPVPMGASTGSPSRIGRSSLDNTGYTSSRFLITAGKALLAVIASQFGPLGRCQLPPTYNNVQEAGATNSEGWGRVGHQ
jgi:hypothetical protein